MDNPLNSQSATADFAECDSSVIAEIGVKSFADLIASAHALELGQVGETTALLADCSDLTPVESDTILKVIKAKTGIGLGVLQKQIKAQSDGDAEPDHLDLARQVIDEIGAENIIGRNSQAWLWGECRVWALVEDRTIKSRVQAKLALTPNVAITNALVNSVSEVLKNEIYAPNHAFNIGDAETVNCLSGHVTIADGGLRLSEHKREEYRTTQIPVEFDPTAKAPRFERFLGEIFRDDDDKADKIAALLELMGYTLMSHARHEKFAVLIGKGANGKSVLLKVLAALVGPSNIAGVQPSNFSNSFQRAYLDQKLANVVTELKQGEVIAGAELKSITSGDPTTVEHKHASPFTMSPFATCWFGTNHLPHTRDYSPALFRRATILEFNRVFTTAEQDPMLDSKLAAEAPGIFNLVLQAYAKAVENGFTNPSSSERAKAEWRLEADQVARFVEDACEKSPEECTPIPALYQAYLEWASDAGVRQTVTKDAMLKRLANLGFEKRRTMAARVVNGLKLRPNYGF